MSGVVRLTLLVAWLLLMSCCTSSSDLIEMTVHLGQGQSWEIHGDAVHDGTVCDRGRRQVIGWRDLTGNPLTFEEWQPLLEQAQRTGGRVVEFAWVHQYVCEDGSGSFDAREWVGPNGGTLEIDGGTEAYAGLKGSIECELIMADAETDQPSESMPMRIDCIGSITVPDG